MEGITYLILFILGIFFGSFFTLAVYRIPRGEDILYKHSYCPNCNHKLATLDLIPVLSYLFLRGRCRYCHEKVRMRYLLLEVLSGLVFVLYGYSIGFSIFPIDITMLIRMAFTILYFVGLFILAGIDKERKEICFSVLWYEVFVTIAYIIYICTLNPKNAYIYVIYLSILILTILLDTVLLRKNAKPSYVVRILILGIAMLMFSGNIVMVSTIVMTGVFLLGYGLINVRKGRKHKFRKWDHPKRIRLPIGCILCVSNMVSILWINYLIMQGIMN